MPTVKGREIGFIRLLHDFAISASSPLPGALSPNSIFDVALDLLKRHSGIVWDPGRFAGLLRCWDVRRLGNPAGAPALGLTNLFLYVLGREIQSRTRTRHSWRGRVSVRSTASCRLRPDVSGPSSLTLWVSGAV